MPLFSGPAAGAAGPGRGAAGWGPFRGGHGQSFKPASQFLVGSAAGPEAPVLSMAGASFFVARPVAAGTAGPAAVQNRSEEHTSELQSLMRISYAVFCLKKKNKKTTITSDNDITP